MAVARAVYRALLREARRLEAARGAVHLLEPVVEADLARYGRGRFLHAPPPPPTADGGVPPVPLPPALRDEQAAATATLQAAWFPGVDFDGGGAREQRRFDGARVRALIRREFRRPRDGAGSGSRGADDAIAALASLNTLRAHADCYSVTYTPYGGGDSCMVVELTTAPVRDEPLQPGSSTQPPGGGAGGDAAAGAPLRHPFVYRIRVHSYGPTECQLTGRQWTFTDAAGGTMVVPRGTPGVVGMYPTFGPAATAFEYISGAYLNTPTGTIEGAFQVGEVDTSAAFDAKVARTALRPLPVPLTYLPLPPAAASQVHVAVPLH